MQRLKPFKTYRSNSVTGKIYAADSVDFLRNIDDEVADIVFLDPPFNLGKQYNDNKNFDRRPENDYQRWIISVLNESIRILRPGAALYLYHLPKWAMRFGSYLESHLDFRHWISVSMKNGFARGKSLYPAHYALLYFTKGKPEYFARPRIQPTNCRHCGGLIKDYGGYRAIIEEKGINLSDVWEDLSPVRHSNRKHRVQNELPVRFMERVVEISGHENTLFVDPFAGGGAGVVAALKHGMRFEACDIVKDNCIVIDERIQEHRLTGTQR